MASEESKLELSDLSFDQLGIKENLLRGVYAYGFENHLLSNTNLFRF